MSIATRDVYTQLASTSRLRLQVGSRTQTALGIGVLLLAGGLAALLVAWVRLEPLHIRLPGHAILKAALPIVCGVALVPRLGSGSVVGVGALLTSALLVLTGGGRMPDAAMISLLALGPAIDLAMMNLRNRAALVYLRFACAGLIANLLAFAVRFFPLVIAGGNGGGGGAGTGGGGGMHHVAQLGWWPLATFALCGLIAGGLSAALCFRPARDAR